MNRTSHLKQLPSLEHHFLLAMPSLDDTYFEKSLIYIVEDNESGTMGITLNHPHTLTIGELLSHFDYPMTGTFDYFEEAVMAGGPVDMERGFILHNPVGKWQSSVPLSDRLAMTVSEDLLKDLAQGKGPDRFVAALGYAGWEPGQLARELQENSWLTIPYNEALLFDVPAEKKWHTALSTLGVSPEFLSMEAGHA
jgi:putative transcriptional regulator